MFTCWEHPEWDHGGEVEGSNASAHSQRYSIAGEVHVLTDPGQSLPQQQRGVGAQVLHHLQSSQHISLSICQGLALLCGDQLGNLLQVVFYQLLVPLHTIRISFIQGLFSRTWQLEVTLMATLEPQSREAWPLGEILNFLLRR